MLSVSNLFGSKKSDTPVNISGRIMVFDEYEESTSFFKKEKKKWYSFGLVLEVPKELSARDSEALEFYSTQTHQPKSFQKMKIGEEIEITLEAERSVSKLFDMFNKNIPAKIKKVGNFKGSGIFSYYGKNKDFTFTTSIARGTFHITNKGMHDNCILKRIK